MTKKITINPRNKIDGNANAAKDTKIRQKIVKLRGEGLSWDKIVKEVKFSKPKVERIYQEEMALSLTVSKRSGNHFREYLNTMDKRYGEVVVTMDRLHNLAKKAIDMIEEEDIDNIQTYIKFMKTSPVIIQIVREIKDQISFVRDEQAKITMEMSKTLPSLADINKHLNTTLNYLHKNGYIKILKQLPIN